MAAAAAEAFEGLDDVQEELLEELKERSRLRREATAPASGSSKSSRRPKKSPNGLPDPSVFLRGISKPQKPPEEDQPARSRARAGASGSDAAWQVGRAGAEAEWWAHQPHGASGPDAAWQAGWEGTEAEWWAHQQHGASASDAAWEAGQAGTDADSRAKKPSGSHTDFSGMWDEEKKQGQRKHADDGPGVIPLPIRPRGRIRHPAQKPKYNYDYVETFKEPEQRVPAGTMRIDPTSQDRPREEDQPSTAGHARSGGHFMPGDRVQLLGIEDCRQLDGRVGLLVAPTGAEGSEVTWRVRVRGFDDEKLVSQRYMVNLS